MPARKTISESSKKQIAGLQFYKCANKPNANLTGLENYECLLWQKEDINKGSFDGSCYEIDHIIEHSIGGSDDSSNLQALCNSCHAFKTRNFMIKKKTLIEMAKEDNYELYKKALLQDKVSILDNIFMDGINDVSGAQLFYCLNPSTYIYDITNRNWYKINDYGIFIPDKNNILLKSQMNNTLLRAIEIEFIKRNHRTTDQTKKTSLACMYATIRKFLSNNFKKEGIINELSLLYKQHNVYSRLDNMNNYAFAFDNGIYDLKTGTFRKGLPEELITCTTGYNYEKANIEVINELTLILETIMPNPIELKYLLKSISIGLLGSNILEEFFIWIGKGANGKGFLSTLIQNTLGNYYDSLDIEYLCKKHQSNPNAPDSVMARKKNSRIVVTTEPEGEVHLKCSKLKQLTGRDEVQVRELYKDPFNFIPKFKLIIQTNQEPIVDGSDGGVVRRLRFIKFPIQFVDNPVLPTEKKINRSLKDKIGEIKYRLAFFQILLNHYNDFVANDSNQLLMPPRILKDTNKFLYANDPVKQFIDDRIIITTNKKDSVSSSTLYDEFVEDNKNDNMGITPAKFKSVFTSNGIEFKRSNKGSLFLGIKIKPKPKVQPNFIDNDVEEPNSDALIINIDGE